MLVIADTSPLNYLVLIDAIDVLARLYERVVLPRGAWEELQHPNAPLVVAQWARALPHWIEVWHPPESLDAALDALGQGEREAIAIAELHQNKSEIMLLLDEVAARKEAIARGIAITGTLGILKAAAAKGWIDLTKILKRLRDTNFRVDSTLLQQMLTEGSSGPT